MNHRMNPTRRAMTPNSLHIATTDIVAAIRRYPLIGMLGWQDIQQRYRRSALGPFWLTLSMGIMIATIGVVFSRIFHSPMKEFLPYLSIGMIFWGFFSVTISEGCMGFINSEGIIKQLPIPLFVHIMRTVWRNTLIFMHNIVIVPVVYLIVGKSVSWVALLSIPGFVLAAVNLIWMALFLGTLCARYRDLPQMIASLLQVLFYLTPVMWIPGSLSQRAGFWLVQLNPVYHLLQIVRAPLLGQMPSAVNWGVTAIMAMAGWAITLWFYGRYQRRIPYWL